MDECQVDFENDEIFDDYRYANYKSLIFNNFGTEIRVFQDFKLGKGGILWEASYVLSKFIQSLDLTNKTVLELGAGTALVSIISATKGASVYSSDITPILSITQCSINHNTSLYKSPITIFELDWTNQSHRSNIQQQHFDYIILSDLFYLPDLASDLFDTIKYFSSPSTTLLICYKYRIDPIVAPFLSHLHNSYTITSHDSFLQSVHKDNSLRLLTAQQKIN